MDLKDISSKDLLKELGSRIKIEKKDKVKCPDCLGVGISYHDFNGEKYIDICRTCYGHRFLSTCSKCGEPYLYDCRNCNSNPEDTI